MQSEHLCASFSSSEHVWLLTDLPLYSLVCESQAALSSPPQPNKHCVSNLKSPLDSNSIPPSKWGPNFCYSSAPSCRYLTLALLEPRTPRRSPEAWRTLGSLRRPSCRGMNARETTVRARRFRKASIAPCASRRQASSSQNEAAMGLVTTCTSAMRMGPVATTGELMIALVERTCGAVLGVRTTIHLLWWGHFDLAPLKGYPR